MSTKLIIGCISGAGVLGGMAVGGFYLFKSEPKKITLKEALQGKDFVALDVEGTTDNDTWKKLITKYNERGTTNKITVIGEITTSSTDDNAQNIKKLQNACATLFLKTENYESDKETAKNWCNKKSKLIPS